jgi:hypothetical protein
MPKAPIPSCFAPVLTDEKLSKYRELVAQVEPGSELADGLEKCLACVEAWYALPESTRTDGAKSALIHQGRLTEVTAVPLENEHVKALWDTTPWTRECEPLKQLFEAISNETHKELRDCAFDLLWHTIEISLDREPLTQDKLSK